MKFEGGEWMDLVTIWSCLIGLAIILYVILDGFSLGVALLFRSTENEEERDILMSSIAPVWDANQTWLVFGGGALFVAFPTIYGVLFSALYIPLLTFVFGLIFRGVTFEFRANATRKGPWNTAFFLGSLVAVVAQGLTLGGILSGTKVAGDRFAGGPFDWLNPFSMTVGMALVAGYILLGSTYLIIKTTGDGAGTGLSPSLPVSFHRFGISNPGNDLDAVPLSFYSVKLDQPAQGLFHLDFSFDRAVGFLWSHQKFEGPP